MTLDERARAHKSIAQLEQLIASMNSFKPKYLKPFTLAEQYYEDAKHYYSKGDYFTSFGCSDYAYGILDTIRMIEEGKSIPTKQKER